MINQGFEINCGRILQWMAKGSVIWRDVRQTVSHRSHHERHSGWWVINQGP